MFSLSNTLLKRVSSFALILGTLIILGCGGGGGGGGTPPPPAGGTGTTPQVLNVTINWTANNETKVNSVNGGYRIYVSQTNGFAVGDSEVTLITVPYVSGLRAPITTNTPLVSGTHYIRVVAFGDVLGVDTFSAPSGQIAIAVPFLP